MFVSKKDLESRPDTRESTPKFLREIVLWAVSHFPQRDSSRIILLCWSSITKRAPPESSDSLLSFARV